MACKLITLFTKEIQPSLDSDRITGPLIMKNKGNLREMFVKIFKDLKELKLDLTGRDHSRTENQALLY